MPSFNAAVWEPGGPGAGAGSSGEPRLPSPDPSSESKTLKHQVQELARLVDGALEDLEQVLRALRMIERSL